MIEAGQTIPSVAVKLVDQSGSTEASSLDILGTGRVVFFSVPGAFTPTCHVNHLPGFIANADKLHAAGLDRIVCGAVNDHHVIKAWGEATGALGKVDFLADARADLARALGLDKAGDLGTRFVRSAMLLRDGTVEAVYVEDAPGVNVSGAPAILMALEALKSTV